jgi:hypothetical protein
MMTATCRGKPLIAASEALVAGVGMGTEDAEATARGE